MELHHVIANLLYKLKAQIYLSFEDVCKMVRIN